MKIDEGRSGRDGEGRNGKNRGGQEGEDEEAENAGEGAEQKVFGKRCDFSLVKFLFSNGVYFRVKFNFCRGYYERRGEPAFGFEKKSRSSRFASWSGDANRFYDKMLRVFYIFLLFAIDFAMFIYSINGKLIEGGTFNQAVLFILGGIFAFSFVLILLLSFPRICRTAFARW